MKFQINLSLLVVCALLLFTQLKKAFVLGQEITGVSFKCDWRMTSYDFGSAIKVPQVHSFFAFKWLKREINMILLYPPHTSLKTIKHNPKASPFGAECALVTALNSAFSPSEETGPNHNIVKALLVFWFKSLFTLFAEYSSAVTAFRQTVSPERGLPQPDLSCWAAAEALLSLAIKWNPCYWARPLGSFHWGGLWASAPPPLATGHPHSPRTPVPLNFIVGTSLSPSATWAAHCASWARLTNQREPKEAFWALNWKLIILVEIIFKNLHQSYESNSYPL